MALNEIVSDHPISWTMSYFDFTVFSSILHGKIPDVDLCLVCYLLESCTFISSKIALWLCWNTMFLLTTYP